MLAISRRNYFVKDISMQCIAAGWTRSTRFRHTVSDSIDSLARPDIIHGNSPIETAAAVLNFPDTPAIFVCHGWDSPDVIAPRMPTVMRYLAVSDISCDRLMYFDGVPEH